MDDGRQRLAEMRIGRGASVQPARVDKPREPNAIVQEVVGAANFYEKALFKQIPVVQKAKQELKGALGVDPEGTVSASVVWSRITELVKKKDEGSRDVQCFLLALKKFERMLDSGFREMDEEIKDKDHLRMIQIFIGIYGDAELKRAAGVS